MKTLIILLLWAFITALMVVWVTGCVTAKVVKPDGTIYEYNRLGNQQVGGVIVEADGSILIENQKAENEALYQALNRLVEKLP